VLQKLYRFHPKSLDLSLGRLHRLLAALGNPEQSLPPVIHVAGTNGKGSTVAFLRAMLEAAGCQVHAYTSPHLVHFNERIRLAGQLISDELLVNLIEEIEAVNGDQPITFFEITTAIAFLAFSRVPADAVLLETGLGGVMDATNVIAQPAATIITRISFDHMHLLGDTIEKIAGEKAGIMKPGVPAIISYQGNAGALETLEKRAAEIAAPLYRYGQEWLVTAQGDGFVYEDAQGRLELPLPALLGAHQLCNAGAAIAALRHAFPSPGGEGYQALAQRALGAVGEGQRRESGTLSKQPAADRLPLTRLATQTDLSPWRGIGNMALCAGLRTVEWPGRLQRLTQGPLVELLPAGWELWLDGGHNDSGGEVLAQQAAKWGDKPLALVFGMLTTKDPQAFLQPLVPYVQAVQTVVIENEPLSLSAEDASVAARAAGMKAEAAENLVAAVSALQLISLRSLPHEGEVNTTRILICGSLYLAGTVLATNS
jgi:dihydrofolate synthase/folylpolyglutamate synthase